MRSVETSRYYHDVARPLPDPTPAPKLRRIHRLSTEPAPEGARQYVKTEVHEIVRPDGSTGYHTVNEMKDGVTLLPIDVVNGHGYVVLVDQKRYPHHAVGTHAPSLREAAERGTITRWSREVISGGATDTEIAMGELGLKLGALREGAEEAGIIGVDPANVHRVGSRKFGSISVNHQSFNVFYTMLGEGNWDPDARYADIEEGELHVGAYRLDTAVPEMHDNGTIIDLSTDAAINGLYRVPELRQYLA